MAYIIAIDPGNLYSGYVILDTSRGFPGKLVSFGKVLEGDLKRKIEVELGPYDELYFAIEMVASYGMAVGQTVFDTCAVIGRLEQYFNLKYTLQWIGADPETGIRSHRIYRKKVSELGINSTTMEMCKTTRAKDTNVRQAVIDLYPATGGGKIPQIGNKKEPGELYGVSKDVWSALAVGLTMQRWLEKAVPN